MVRGSCFYESRTATTPGTVDALFDRHSFTRSCVHKQHNNQFMANGISIPAREDYVQASMQWNMDSQTHGTTFTSEAYGDTGKEKLSADLPCKAISGNNVNVDGHRGCYYETEDAYYQETEDVEYKIKEIGVFSVSSSGTWYQKLRSSSPRSSTQAGDPKDEDNGYDDNPGQVCLLQVTAILQALTWTRVAAWDEDFFQNVMARQQANNMFGLPTQSWAWARLQARIPGPTESNRLQIYRSSAPIFRQPNFYQLHTTMESTPIQVVTTIGMAWNDLTPTDGHSIFWQLHLADYHARFSPTVLPGHSIQVLVSSQENAALHGLNEAVILIDTHDHSYTPPTLMMKAYTVQRFQNRLSLLQEAGLIVQCSTTHLCRAWRNGNECNLHYVAVDTADFINIQVKDRSIYGPAVDIYATAPRDAEDVESQATDEPPVEDNAQQVEDASDASNPASDYMIVIRRPRPSQVTDSFHIYVGDREEEEAAAQARRKWPDLEGLEPTIKEVDASFYNSFPQEEGWVVYLAINSVTFNAMPHMRAVIILLRRFGEADYQAMAIAHLTSELGVLSRCRLLHECKVAKIHYCVTTHNGERVFGSTRVEVEHGDFIRVDLIDKDNVMQEVKLLSTTEEDYVRNDRTIFWPHSTLSISGEQSQQNHVVSTSSGIRTDRHSLHEHYWFTLTAILWIFVPILLRLHEREHPSPKVRKYRRKCNRAEIRLFKTLFLCGLLITQHWHGALALQQRQATAARNDDVYGDWGPKSITISRHEQQQWTRDCVQGLRPPGNPECDVTQSLQLTAQGEYLTGRIVQHLEFCEMNAKISECLRHIARPLKRYSAMSDAPPVQISLEASLFHNRSQATTQDQDHAQTPVHKVADTSASSTYVGHGGFKGAPRGIDFGHYSLKVGADLFDAKLGLTTPWEMTKPSTLCDLLEEIPVFYPQALLIPCDEEVTPPYILHIYTDGSSKTQDGITASSWSVIIMYAHSDTPQDAELRLVDWLCGTTQDDPLHPQWLGAEKNSSRTGEAEALAWALLWILQSETGCEINIHVDATSVLHAASGQWGHHPDDHLLRRLRALYQQICWPTQYVKGHGSRDAQTSTLVGGCMANLPSLNGHGLWRTNYRGKNPYLCTRRSTSGGRIGNSLLPHKNGFTIYPNRKTQMRQVNYVSKS